MSAIKTTYIYFKVAPGVAMLCWELEPIWIRNLIRFY